MAGIDVSDVAKMNPFDLRLYPRLNTATLCFFRNRRMRYSVCGVFHVWTSRCTRWRASGKAARVLPGFASTATRDAGAAVFTWRYVTNEVTKGSKTTPLDIVLVLDVSGSMDDDLGESTWEYG